MRNTLLRGVVLASALAAVGCSPSSTPATGEAAGGAGGTVSNGGSSSKSSASSKASTGGSKATSKTGKGGNSAATGNEGGASDGGEGATEGGESAGGAASSSKSSGSSKGGSSPKSSSGATGGAKTSGSGTSAGGATEGGASSTATEGGSTGVEPTGVAVRLDKTHQTIQGFGLNSALMPDNKTIPVDKIYSTEGTDGIGLSILRVGMDSTGKLTGKYVSEAKAKGAKVIGSTWTPPAECKSNGKLVDGGYLLDKCFDSWSTTIANFAKAQGLYAMSIANESDFASCPGVPVCTDSYDTTTFTAKQMVAWVKKAGAALKALNPPVKVIAPEASEWIHAWSNLSGTGSIVSSHPNSSDPHKCGCFSNTISAEAEAKCAQKCLDGDGYDYGHWMWKDQEAWKSFDILGVHQYDSQIAYAWPADVNDGKRDREVWQTEMSGVMHWPEQGPSIDIKNGVAVAGWIHSALTVGEASAWLYWWWEAYYKDDNEGLALVQSEASKSNPTYAKRFYTLGNYSKFVRPGYIAVEVTGNSNADVLLSGYKSEDGKTVVIVAINKGGSAATVPIGFAGGTAPASCTPNVTSASDNIKAGTAVTVSDGTLSAALAATTVTTYVCK